MLVLADIRAPNRDRHDLRARGLGRAPRFVEITELAGAGQEARAIALAGDDEGVVVGIGRRAKLGIHRFLLSESLRVLRLRA